MKQKKITGIYAIVNKINGKQYIGSTKNVVSRWGIHRYYLRKGEHHSPILQFAWDKYGEDAFELEIIEYCETEIRVEREQFYLDTWLPEYNIVRTVTRPDERLRTPENEAKRIAALRSPEVVAKLSASRKLIPRTLKWRTNIGDSLRGIKRGPRENVHVYSQEERLAINAKISASNAGKPKAKHFYSDDELMAMAKARSDWFKNLSPEKRAEFDARQAKMVQAALTPEAREKQRLASKATYAARPEEEKQANREHLLRIHAEMGPRSEASLKKSSVSISAAHARRTPEQKAATQALFLVLTPENVRDIKAEYAGGLSSIKLAAKYGVSKPTILKVIHGTYPVQPAP